MMKIIQRLWTAAGLPCRECGGKGYVVASDVAAFIERNGLAAFQAAETLMINEIEYGALGSIPVSTWENVGLSEDEAEYFATDVGCGRVLHSCPSCGGQPDHEDALGLATSIIRSLKANDRRRRAEWEANRTREQQRQRWRNMAWIAVQSAQMSRELARELDKDRQDDAGSFGDMALPMGEF